MLAALAAIQDPSYVESYWEVLLETSVSSSQFCFNPTEIVGLMWYSGTVLQPTMSGAARFSNFSLKNN